MGFGGHVIDMIKRMERLEKCVLINQNLKRETEQI
jgi:hypothetical protein